MNAKQELINYDEPSMIATLKATVAQGATDAEFAMFTSFCKTTGLNPFKKEIWFVKSKGYTNKYGKVVEGRVQMMTGINGFQAIANSHPEYNGMETGLIGPNGEYLAATYPKDDFIGAWCRVHRKDRQFPTEGIAMLSEYDKSEPDRDSVWKKMRRMMIMKCAKSVGLREALPQQLNGLYTQEEMPAEYSAAQAPSAPPEPKVKPSIKPKKEEIDNDLQAVTRGLLYEAGVETYQYDLHGIGNTASKKKNKAELWDEIKAMGGIAVGKVLHSAEELPDFESFEIGRPMSQLSEADNKFSAAYQDEIDFSKESEELARKK